MDEIQNASVMFNKQRSSTHVDGEEDDDNQIDSSANAQRSPRQSLVAAPLEVNGNEPKERTELPWLKDPNIKISIWAIIKDSIGKDISKLTVPVYMNDPENLLQKCASSLEYSHILDKVCACDDQVMRLGLMAVFGASMTSSCERNPNKPFNPILGETYELVTDDYEFLAEQVSHHPPVSANYCKGKKSNYIYWNN